MIVVAIISQKGGAGKTTIAVHLATAASAAGYSTAIVDLDPQGTAAAWGDRRVAETPEVISGQAARLPVLLQSAKQHGAELLILDTAPNADQAATMAARAADLVLIPCRPSTFDLGAIESTLALCRAMEKHTAIVLNAVPARGPLGREAAEGLTERGVAVAPVMLRQRAAYAYGVMDGRTAQEFDPHGKAAGEVTQLFQWVFLQFLW